ncbi:MAG: hypothetical protein DCC67_08260 [Planctomycetota bacterium]|nr:MAG: hypothetical protein DCC67_08260 [Planctomycetota bacterium]
MSSLFNGDWRTRPVRWALALSATLACATTSAQAIEGDSLAAAVEGRAYSGTTPLRIEHRTRGYAQEASDTAVGGRLGFVDMADAVGFADGQFRVNNESRVGVNTGLGYRWYNDSFLTGDTRILGVSGWYDGQETVNDNYFNQLGVSLESLGELLDLRLNANIPLDDSKTGDRRFFTDDINFFGNNIGQQFFSPTDVALRVVDFEAAARVFDLNIWVFGGGYQMDGDDVSDTGAKGGVRGYLTNDLLVGVTVTDDQVFGTNTIAQVIWTPGRVGSGPTSWVHTLADRMREHVYRNTYVATRQTLTEGSLALTGVDGQAIRVVHVNSSSGAAGTGDGTFENPLTSLDSINANSQQGDIILVHANTDYSGQSATLKNEQRLLGEGGGNVHTIVTSERGTINLPETFAGASAAERPDVINPDNVNSVILAGVTTDNTGLSEIEVSNFDFDGGASAIVSGTNGVGDVNINRLAIANTDDYGIKLTALTQTSNGAQRVLFTPTIDTVAFSSVGDGADDDDDDILLTSVTEPSGNNITETITINRITSSDGEGVGVNLQNTRRTATISNVTWDGNTTGDGGIRVQGAGSQAAIALNGTNAIREGQNASPDDSGFGIALENSAGTMTVTGTTITNTGGDSVIINGGSVVLNYTGRIEQGAGSTAVATTSAVSVLGAHSGSATFTELTADAGVVAADRGDGLQFDNADGVYTFNDEVELAGTVNAVSVENGSDAVLTLQNAQFSNTSGTTMLFDGGDANMTLTGRIVQNANNTVLDVRNGHTGTLAFTELTNNQGVIDASSGAGLSFNNADGAYTFNDEVELSGTTAAIAVAGNSEGTFTFANADIDYNGAGNAVSITASDVQAFTISGDVTTTGASSRPVLVSANTGGSITFNNTITGTNSLGVQVIGNTDTTVRFASQTTLSTGANTGVQVDNNANGGVRFDALDVTTTTGAAFTATNTDNLTVQGTGNTLTTTGGTALNLNDVQIGGAGATFESVSAAGVSGAGVVLDDVRGGTVAINDGNVSAIGAGATSDAVRITNAANVSLNSMTLSSANGQALDFNSSSSATSRLTFTNNAITQGATALEGVLLNVDQNATQVLLTVSGNTVTHNGTDEAIRLQTADASAKTVTMLLQNNTVTASSADAAANFQVAGGATLNATVRNNTFNNGGAGPAFEMDNREAGSRTRLDLDANVANGGSQDYLLEETAGVFTLQDEATVQARNTGTVTRVGTIDEETGVIPTP